MRYDDYGLITQLDGDAGDCAQREGFYFFGKWLIGEPVAKFFVKGVLDLLQESPGIFRRHPSQWNDPNDLSRDQHNPLVIAMGAYGIKDTLWITFKSHVKRFGRYQNKDWAGPHDWGCYVRSFRCLPLYPYLLFSDLFLVIGSIINILKSFDRGYTDDAPNWCMLLVQAKYFMPTPISWLARKIYYRFRQCPLDPPSMERPTWVRLPYDSIKTALYYYFDPKFGGNIELAQLWEPIIEQG